MAITVFKVGQRAGRALSHEQAKKSVDRGVCETLCAFVPSAHPDIQATLLVVSVSVDAHRNPQKQTASQGFPDSLLLK